MELSRASPTNTPVSPADAVLAYQRALTLDRDLVEAHYNLGCLWLEQNKPDVAKTEFTAYVLRRSKAPEGWTKLGVAQLRLRDLASAEKSFSAALSLDTNNAEALNGLGLAQMQRGHPREAVQYFAAADQAQPDYAPALLNLATMARQYLRDNTLALQNYRAYLALTPRRADWDQVNAIANDLEQQMNGTAASALVEPTADAADGDQYLDSLQRQFSVRRYRGPIAVRRHRNAKFVCRRGEFVRGRGDAAEARQRETAGFEPAQSDELVSRHLAGAEGDAIVAIRCQQ